MASDRPSLLALTTRSDYADRVCAVLRHLHESHDETQAVELLQELTHRMGAQGSVFASFIRDDDESHSYRRLIACDAASFSSRERRADIEDAWIVYAQKCSETVRSSEASAAPGAAAAAAALAQDFGFRSCVVVPAPSSGGLSRVGVLCLGSSIPGYFDDDGYLALKVLARGVAMELHEWLVRRLRDELLAQSSLVAQDLVLLAHEYHGQTTKMIARDLGSTTGAVDSRFQRVNIKLGVASRRAAARKAAEYGLIE